MGDGRSDGAGRQHNPRKSAHASVSFVDPAAARAREMWNIAAIGFGNWGQGSWPVAISTSVQPTDQTSLRIQPSKSPDSSPRMSSGAIQRGVPRNPEAPPPDASSPSFSMRFEAPKSASFAPVRSWLRSTFAP